MKPTDLQRPTGLEPIKTGLRELTLTTDAIESKINHKGDRPEIIIPRGRSLTTVGKAILKYAEAEEALTEIHHRVDTAHYFCAAWNLQQALSEHYGIDFASPKPGLMGDTPPQKITFPLAHDKTATITIGQFNLQDMLVETSMASDDNNVPRLKITVTCKNLDSDKASRLFALVDQMPNPWKGKTLIFNEGREPRMVEIDHSDITREQIALNPTEDAALSLFTDQIAHHEKLKEEAGIFFKRGVLLHGPWGTGKTLAAAVFMAQAEAAGITVIHERDLKRLKQTMMLAKSMQPCMVFIEDIDRMHDSIKMELINFLDDASEKDSQTSIVVTTNYVEKLDDALKRTGRLDIAIDFALPEPATRRKILSINKCNQWNEDISDATKGMTGSDMAEISRRAQISAIANGCEVTTEHVFSAASTMVKPPRKVESADMARMFTSYLHHELGIPALGGMLDRIHSLTDEIDNRTIATNAVTSDIMDLTKAHDPLIKDVHDHLLD